MKKISKKNKVLLIALTLLLLLSIKTNAQDLESTSFKIKGDLVATPGNDATSTNFKMNGDMNPFSDPSVSTSYKLNGGYNPRLQANKPTAPTLSNSSNYYDRLQISINASENPTDTLYAVAVSTDDWATYKYLQAGGTLGNTLTITDYKLYADLNNSYILGLFPATGYKARVKALSGDFTETGYSESSAEVKTEVPNITLDISSDLSDLGTLSASVVATGNPTTTLTVNTNTINGFTSFIKGVGNGAAGGLYNGATLISSADATLSAGTEGYGAQASSATATIDSKYNKTGNDVGEIDITNNTLGSKTGTATNNTIVVTYKAAVSGTTTPGSYRDTVYYTISPSL